MIRLFAVRTDNKRVALDTAGNPDEARELAQLYVDDPRDTVQAVYLWDVRAHQYIGWVSRKKPVYRGLRDKGRKEVFA